MHGNFSSTDILTSYLEQKYLSIHYAKLFKCICFRYRLSLYLVSWNNHIYWQRMHVLNLKIAFSVLISFIFQWTTKTSFQNQNTFWAVFECALCNNTCQFSCDVCPVIHVCMWVVMNVSCMVFLIFGNVFCKWSCLGWVVSA